MNATARGSLLAALACVLVGASFTANSVLGHYPYAGGQFLRYGLACVLLLPSAGRGGTAPLRRLAARQWGRLALLAAVGMVGFNLAVISAERTAEPAVPGVFVGCAPVVVAVVVPLLEGRRPQRPVLYGASFVAVGACMVQGGAAPTARGSRTPCVRWPARWASRSSPCRCCAPSVHGCCRRPSVGLPRPSRRWPESSSAAAPGFGCRTPPRPPRCCGRRRSSPSSASCAGTWACSGSARSAPRSSPASSLWRRPARRRSSASARTVPRKPRAARWSVPGSPSAPVR